MSEVRLNEIKSISYKRPEIERGYTDHTLSVDVSGSEIRINPVDEKTKEIFVGGKGYDLRLLWDSVKPTTKWDDPENAICIASGPLGGTPNYPGSGKSIVTTISPLTGIPIDGNVGGFFGPYLKFSGFDAMEVHGIADTEVIVLIDGIDEKIKIFECEGLPEDSYETSRILTEHFGEDKPRSISVVSSGQGGKNSMIGCLNFTWYDAARKMTRYKQAGRGGIGTVLAQKNIKALVARWSTVSIRTNKPANEDLLKEVGKLHTQEIVELDPKQNEMASVGTAHLVTIMNDFDLLPINNYRYGMHPQAPNLGQEIYRRLFDKGFDGCWLGCTVSCAHGVRDFVPFTGPYMGKKVFVDGPEYETIAGCGSNIGIFDPLTVIEINFYCDAYGIDTISYGTSLAFAMECFEMGLINEKQTGGIDLSFGNRLSALEVLHQLGRGEGIGRIVGQGIRRMREIFASEFGADMTIMKDIGMESKGLETSVYMTKESLAQQGGYGLTLKGPQHDEAWLIFLDMVHNYMPSFEEKAEALHWFPMFRTWFGLCGLCKLPWNDIVPEDNKDMPEPAKVIKHVEWYAQYFSSVTGRKVGPDDLIEMSEKVYNFQRIFNLRMGYGRRADDYMPYRAIGPVTVDEYESRRDRYDKQLSEQHGIDVTGKSTEEKMAALRKIREDNYEKLKDAVYARRGWNSDGIPTLATVKRLGIDFPDVVELLKSRGVKE